jgi:hypothetical protein
MLTAQPPPSIVPGAHPALAAIDAARDDLAAAIDLLARDIGMTPELGRIAVRIWDDLSRLRRAMLAAPRPR